MPPIFRVTRESDNRGASFRVEGRIIVREHTVQYTVECLNVDGYLVGPEQVVLAPGLPRLGTPFVGALGGVDWACRLRSLVPQPTANRSIWKVVAEYSNMVNPQFIENPILRPPEISFDATRTAVPFTHDTIGNPIINSAGDPFDPPPEKDILTLVINISRNQLTFPAVFYLGFWDKVNDKVFMGFMPRQVRLVSVTGSSAYENFIYYWKARFQFEVRFENLPENYIYKTEDEEPKNLNKSMAWTQFYLDRGFRKIVMRNGVPTYAPCTDPLFGQPVSQPALLDGEGNQLQIGDTPKFLAYEKYSEADFDLLRLFPPNPGNREDDEIQQGGQGGVPPVGDD